jgi:hypothetical protein
LTFPAEGFVMGRPEYQSEGEWRGLCDDTYNDTNTVASAVCRTMGLNGDGATMTQGMAGPSDNFWFDNVECTDGATTIWDCDYTFGEDNCGSTETMYVTCSTGDSDSASGTGDEPWRLEDISMDENGMVMGRPEYNNEGEWRPICDDTYSNTEGVASVLCGMMGF